MNAPQVKRQIRTLFIGFSAAAEVAANLLLRAGQSPQSIAVITARGNRADVALALGLIVEEARPTTTAVAQNIHTHLTKVIVDPDDDGEAEDLVQLARLLAPAANIVVNVRQPQSVRRMLAAGASSAFCEGSIAGVLLAETVCSSPSNGVVN